MKNADDVVADPDRLIPPSPGFGRSVSIVLWIVVVPVAWAIAVLASTVVLGYENGRVPGSGFIQLPVFAALLWGFHRLRHGKQTG